MGPAGVSPADRQVHLLPRALLPFAVGSGRPSQGGEVRDMGQGCRGIFLRSSHLRWEGILRSREQLHRNVSRAPVSDRQT
eukprot:1754439-Pyramimonas_sp.AAC.1